MQTIAKIRYEIDKGWRRLRAPRGQRELPREFPLDFTPFTKKLWRQVSPHTLTSKERVATIENAVRYIHKHGIEGDFVECGVAWGGSVMAFAICLMALGERDRRIWLYDTFEGMTEPTDRDVGRFGEKAIKQYRKHLVDGVSTWVRAPIDQVKRNVFSVGYPEQMFTFVQGKVEETLPQTKPERIAFLRLDTDWYESTRAEMEHLFPRLERGGILLLDDYYRYRGHREAVNGYLERAGVPMFLARIDEHAVVGVKP